MSVTGEMLFTPTEAAVLTRLSVKTVNNAIDKRTIPTVAPTSRRSGRMVDLLGLLSLTLERRLADRFAPELRRSLFAALSDASNRSISLDDGLLTIDLRGPRRELAESVRALRRAKDMVVTDLDILGGEPVFRGTRIPVHLIAALLEAGDSEQEVLAAYPRLTTDMIQAGRLYAKAYPPRGRPRTATWPGGLPRQRIRVKLASPE